MTGENLATVRIRSKENQCHKASNDKREYLKGAGGKGEPSVRRDFGPAMTVHDKCIRHTVRELPSAGAWST